MQFNPKVAVVAAHHNMIEVGIGAIGEDDFVAGLVIIWDMCHIIVELSFRKVTVVVATAVVENVAAEAVDVVGIIVVEVIISITVGLITSNMVRTITHNIVNRQMLFNR